MVYRILVAALFAASLQSCSKKINYALITGNAKLNISAREDSLEIHFLGTTCFWISYKGDAVLTDPFVSNPAFRKVMFGKIRPDSSIISDFVSNKELGQVTMVTVGHAHYDHLLDLPYMQSLIPPYSKLIGSPTTHHIIAASNPLQEKIIANDFIATVSSEGKWIYSNNKKIRVMPVASDHPPHFMGITLYGGNYSKDLNDVPDKSRKWKMGEPFAYLIDFMESDGSIAYRIWMQSSGSEYPLGFIPESILKEKRIDVAMLSVATAIKPESYPDKIIELLKPKSIFMIHWENFWRDKYKPLKTVQKGNPEKLFHYLKGKFAEHSEVILPKPGGRFILY